MERSLLSCDNWQAPRYLPIGLATTGKILNIISCKISLFIVTQILQIKQNINTIGRIIYVKGTRRQHVRMMMMEFRIYGLMSFSRSRLLFVDESRDRFLTCRPEHNPYKRTASASVFEGSFARSFLRFLLSSNAARRSASKVAMPVWQIFLKPRHADASTFHVSAFISEAFIFDFRISVAVPLQLAAFVAMTGLEFAVDDVLWYTVVGHPDDVTSPSQLGPDDRRFYSRHVASS